LLLIIARGIAAGYEAVQTDLKSWSEKYSSKEDEYEVPESGAPVDPSIPVNSNFTAGR
jgi:hypothetical protein